MLAFSQENQEKFFPIFHPFQANRLDGGIAVWTSQRYRAGNCSADSDPLDHLREAFSYVIPGGATFDKLRINPVESVTLRAERYGGDGIDDNGGGVRCGNLGNFQIKGIGRNLLVGAAEDFHHSYGGLSAVHAVHETIMSIVVEKLFPTGSAHVYGLILTGPTAALFGKESREWGALLVREPVFRPANFLRAGFYVPANSEARRMLSDVARVRITNKELMSHFGGTREFIRAFGEFLMKCADQFAFAKIARLSHGAVSPSNLCVDGRWLDLTHASFLRSAENHVNAHGVSFLQEQDEIYNLIYEFTSTFSKYNQVEINPKTLVDYYRKVCDLYFRDYLGWLLGVKVAPMEEPATQADLECLKLFISRIFDSAALVKKSLPEDFDESDPVLCFIERAYAGLSREGSSGQPGSGMSWQDSPDKLELDAFNRVLATAFQRSGNVCSYRAFVIVSFIKAFKRSRLVEYYYKPVVAKRVNAVLGTGKVSEIGNLIDDASSVLDWSLNEDKSDSATLYQGEKLSIVFDAAGTHFVVVNDVAGERLHLASVKELGNYIASAQLQGCFSEIFDFGPYLSRMLNIVEILMGLGGHVKS